MNMEDLARRVIIDRLPVTVSYISKTDKICISKAAEILEEFYQKYKHEGLHAKYSSCQKEDNGSKRPTDLFIKIGEKGDRIFSVQIDNSSLTNVLEMCKKRWDTETLTTCGMIQTRTYESKEMLTETVDIEETNKSSVQPEPKKSSIRTKPITNSEPVNRPVYTSRKAASAPSTNVNSKKPVYTSRKRGIEQSQQKEETKRKQEATKRAKTVPSQTISKELEELMEDDFTDDDDDVKIEEDDGVEEYKYDDIDVSVPDETKQVDTDDFTQKEHKEHSNPIERIAKREPKSPAPENDDVVEDAAEIETHVDADGYIVTKKHRKTPQPPPQQSTKKYNIDTKPKSNSSSKPGTKQSTLASFFGKKK